MLLLRPLHSSSLPFPAVETSVSSRDHPDPAAFLPGYVFSSGVAAVEALLAPEKIGVITPCMCSNCLCLLIEARKIFLFFFCSAIP